MPVDLRGMLRGADSDALHKELQDVVRSEAFRQDGCGTDRTARVYGQLRAACAALGPARELALYPRKLSAFLEWTAVAAPDAVPVFLLHYQLAVGTVLALGEGCAGLEAHLAELDDASAAGAFLVTELGHGGSAHDLETRAVHDAATGDFVVDTPATRAVKFVANLAHSGTARTGVVAARLIAGGEDHGVFPFVMRLRERDGRPARGVTITPLPEKPFPSADCAAVSFDGVRIPGHSLLTGGTAGFRADGSFRSSITAPRERFRHTTGQLYHSRTSLAAAAMAMARAALVITLRYAAQRQVPGPGGGTVPMLAYRTVQRDLFTGLARVFAGSLLAERAKDTVAVPSLDREADELFVMVIKVLLTETALQTVQVCRARCGAQGLFTVNRIAEFLTACQGFVTSEGDNQVLSIAAGRRLCADPRHGPGEGCPGPGGPDGPSFWSALMAERERRLVRSVPHHDTAYGFDAWNAQVLPAAALADARAQRLALDALVEGVERCTDPTDAEALTLLAELCALDHGDRHSGWYLREGLLTPAQAARTEERAVEVCDRLVPHVPALLDAFGIPDDLLAAPIAAADYTQAWRDVLHLT
ncbi:acyl-CoA dehydrogenase family protein [Streptomyces sp. NPDC002536]